MRFCAVFPCSKVRSKNVFTDKEKILLSAHASTSAKLVQHHHFVTIVTKETSRISLRRRFVTTLSRTSLEFNELKLRLKREETRKFVNSDQ